MKQLCMLIVLGASAAFGAAHYSFQGSDPARWTTSVDSQPGATGSGFTTYIGDGLDYQVARIVTDASGSTYISGNRLISATSGPFFRQEITDVFVTKLDPSGNLVFTATIGGKGADRAGGIALDSAGNICIAGSTSSPNFPLRNPLQSLPSLGQSGFLVKLSPDGSRLLYSSYFGGTLGATAVNALAVDAAGNMYVTGNTFAADFPHTAGLPSGKPVLNTVPQYGDAFLTKISADGSKIVYSAILTGGAVSCGSGSSCFLSGRITSGVDIGLDAVGNAYIAGNTNTTDLPTTPGAFLKQGIGAFVAKVNVAGTALVYLTYLGAANYVIPPVGIAANTATALAIDAAGNAYVTGTTTDPNFPATPGSLQPLFSGPSKPEPFPPPPADAFVAKLSSDGTKILWATFLGGSDDDSTQSIALDSSANVWLSGTTASPEFPNKAGWSGGRDFVVELSATGSALSYSSRFPDGSASEAIAVDAGGSVHFAGASGIVSTLAANQTLPARVFGVATAAAGTVSGRIAPGELIAIYGPHIGPSAPVTFTVDASGFVPKSLAGIQVSFDGMLAPLLYVSDNQINAIVPFGLLGRNASHIRVSSSSGTLSDFPVIVLATAPAIFQKSGASAALNEDGSINSASNPAALGSVVSIFATGTGAIPAADGQTAGSAQDYHCCQVSVNGQSADVLYAGAAPGIVAGVTQINFRVPAALLFPTASSITITAGGSTSSGAGIYLTK